MKIRYLALLGVLAPVLGSAAAHADTITMAATYFTIGESDQDMNHLAPGVFNNEVQNSLGADGLPILNTAAFGCSSNCFTATPMPADLTKSGEITWWSPALNNGAAGGTSDVTETGTGTITLPYSNGSFYPPNGGGTNDENGFQAAIFSTILNVPTKESINFNVGADDIAFVYLNGSLVCDLGGVHPDAPGTCTSGVLPAGANSLELFYADLENTQAALTFGVTTAGISGGPPPTNVPEPFTLSMVGAGLAGVAAMRRRKKAVTA